jgi:hypothetical protein
MPERCCCAARMAAMISSFFIVVGLPSATSLLSAI